MSTFKTRVACGALALVVSAGAFAQTAAPTHPSTATPRVDRREAHQQERIANGAASGQLTGTETRRLEKEQARIDRTEARARSDGVVTARERRHLAREQNRASRDIARQKHDAQVARRG